MPSFSIASERCRSTWRTCTSDSQFLTSASMLRSLCSAASRSTINCRSSRRANNCPFFTGESTSTINSVTTPSRRAVTSNCCSTTMGPIATNASGCEAAGALDEGGLSTGEWEEAATVDGGAELQPSVPSRTTIAREQTRLFIGFSYHPNQDQSLDHSQIPKSRKNT